MLGKVKHTDGYFRILSGISVRTEEVQGAESQSPIGSCRSLKTGGLHHESSAEPSNSLQQGAPETGCSVGKGLEGEQNQSEENRTGQNQSEKR